MTQTDNYLDVAGGQAIFQPALNPDVPTQTGPVLLKWRGIWTPGVLYNKNDLVKVPMGGAGGAATLEIALQTHVSSLVFADDIALWGRVLDASELQGSGVPPDVLQAFINQAAAAAQQASGSATTAAGHADRAKGYADGMTANINTALDQMDSSVGEAGAIRDDTSNLNAQAQTAAGLAQSYGTAPRGVIVDPATGSESAYSNMLQARDMLVSTALTPYLYVDDPATGSGQFDAVPDATWLGRKVVVRSTRACRIVLPVNLNRQVWTDGSDAAAFFRIKAAGAGALTVVPSVPAVVTPDYIIDDHYSARITGIAGTTTVLRSLIVPPGSNRFLTFMAFSTYETLDSARALTLTAQVRGGAAFTMTKLQGPLTTNQYNASGQQLAGTLWIGAIPDSSSVAQTIDVTAVYSQQLFLYDQYCFVAGPCSGYNATTVGASDSAAGGAFADIALTVAAGKANSLAVLGFGGRQASLPSGVNPGTSRFAGLTAPPADPTGGRNNSTIFAYDKNLTVGAKSWRGTWAGVARHATLGVLLEPLAAGVAPTIRTTSTIASALSGGIAAGQEYLVEALSDGLTYDVS